MTPSCRRVPGRHIFGHASVTLLSTACSTSVVPKLEWSSESPTRGLLQTQSAGPCPRVPDPVGLRGGWGRQEFTVLTSSPSGFAVAGPRTIVWKLLPLRQYRTKFHIRVFSSFTASSRCPLHESSLRELPFPRAATTMLYFAVRLSIFMGFLGSTFLLEMLRIPGETRKCPKASDL